MIIRKYQTSHSLVIVERCCVADWTPRGTSIRVTSGSKFVRVLDNELTDEQALEIVEREVLPELTSD